MNVRKLAKYARILTGPANLAKSYRILLYSRMMKGILHRQL